MSDADKLRDASPWHPIDNKVDLKHLGKLGEELNELSAAASKCGAAVCRCIIQGVDEAEPVTGKVNREWLEDEIADVEAGSELAKRRFSLDRERIAARAAKKLAYLQQWHALA